MREEPPRPVQSAALPDGAFSCPPPVRLRWPPPHRAEFATLAWLRQPPPISRFAIGSEFTQIQFQSPRHASSMWNPIPATNSPSG
jgi:hypothetical protein